MAASTTMLFRVRPKELESVDASTALLRAARTAGSGGVVSPLIRPNLIEHKPFDHTAIPATLRRVFNLPSLGARDGLSGGVDHLAGLFVARTDAPMKLPNVATAGVAALAPTHPSSKTAARRPAALLSDDPHGNLACTPPLRVHSAPRGRSSRATCRHPRPRSRAQDTRRRVRIPEGSGTTGAREAGRGGRRPRLTRGHDTEVGLKAATLVSRGSHINQAKKAAEHIEESFKDLALEEGILGSFDNAQMQHFYKKHKLIELRPFKERSDRNEGFPEKSTEKFKYALHYRLEEIQRK